MNTATGNHKSRLVPIVAVVSALVIVFACDDESLLREFSNTEIQLSASLASVEADGQSTVVITATASPAERFRGKSIQFATTAGQFVGTSAPATPLTVTADSNGMATVDLRAPGLAGVARVSASVGSTVGRLDVTLAPAPPDRISVGLTPSPSLTASAGGFITTTALLFRDIGTVSVGTVVDWSAVPDAAQVGWSFYEIRPSDAAGMATAKFTVGTSSYRGPLLITAKFTRPDGTIVSGSATVIVIAPS